MNGRHYAALSGALAVLSFASSSGHAQTTPIVIRAGRLIDGRGGSTAGATITIAGGRITAVGAAGALLATYDLSRYTVLPGLIDGHDHIGWHFNGAGRFHVSADGETATQCDHARR